MNLVANSDIPSAISRAEFVGKSNVDQRLVEVKKAIAGKPHRDIGIYARILNDLSVTDDGLMLNNDKICVPESLQQRIIDIAHEGHLGIVKTKQLLRRHAWFPNIDEWVEKTAKSCHACQCNVDSSRTLPLKMSPMPDGPWLELSIDFYGPLSTGKYRSLRSTTIHGIRSSKQSALHRFQSCQKRS